MPANKTTTAAAKRLSDLLTRNVLSADKHPSVSIRSSKTKVRRGATFALDAEIKKPAQKVCCRFHHSLPYSLGDQIGRSVHRVN
jgi:hypothetical protein